MNTIEIFVSLGFTFHPGKFEFILTQYITYLGFVSNSAQTTITLILEKKEKILNLCQEILWEDVFTIKFLSKLIANLVAAFPAVTSCPFYHRDLEMCKTKALQQSNENHDVSVRLSSEAEKWEKDEKRN